MTWLGRKMENISCKAPIAAKKYVVNTLVCAQMKLKGPVWCSNRLQYHCHKCWCWCLLCQHTRWQCSTPPPSRRCWCRRRWGSWWWRSGRTGDWLSLGCLETGSQLAQLLDVFLIFRWNIYFGFEVELKVRSKETDTPKGGSGKKLGEMWWFLGE